MPSTSMTATLLVALASPVRCRSISGLGPPSPLLKKKKPRQAMINTAKATRLNTSETPKAIPRQDAPLAGGVARVTTVGRGVELGSGTDGVGASDMNRFLAARLHGTGGAPLPPAPSPRRRGGAEGFPPPLRFGEGAGGRGSASPQ